MMFDELEIYENRGHFFFEPGGNLRELSAGVPYLHGVYYILRLSRGRVELVYIGRSGTIRQDGAFRTQTLVERINNRQDGKRRQDFFDQKMVEERIDALDIYWFVTFDDRHRDLPGYVEGLLMQSHFERSGELPVWNKSF